MRTLLLVALSLFVAAPVFAGKDCDCSSKQCAHAGKKGKAKKCHCDSCKHEKKEKGAESSESPSKSSEHEGEQKADHS